jgi:hypothetical protein
VGYPATATPASVHAAIGAALLLLGLLALALARRERA